MKPENRRTEDASSVQIGFILNTGIMTIFIAVMLLVTGGTITDDVSTEEELEHVAGQIEANLIEADMLRQRQIDSRFTAYFDPPRSGIDYDAEMDGGTLTLSAPDGTVLERRYPVSDTPGTVDDGISFTQNDERIIVSYDSDVSPQLKLELQEGVARDAE